MRGQLKFWCVVNRSDVLMAGECDIMMITRDNFCAEQSPDKFEF
jgi:hypothetical protein